jgi:hypothetical protein
LPQIGKSKVAPPRSRRTQRMVELLREPMAPSQRLVVVGI